MIQAGTGWMMDDTECSQDEHRIHPTMAQNDSRIAQHDTGWLQDGPGCTQDGPGGRKADRAEIEK